MAKKPTRKTIVKKLDKLFSLYIRTRYAKNEIAECITCGKKAHYKKLQAGHFMSRKNYATRWEEKNVEVQCYACNVMRYGEQYKFGEKLKKDTELKEAEDKLARDFAKKEKNAARAQAVINGALAITKVLAQTGTLSPFVIPMIVASTMAQLAVIESQQFAKGGMIEEYANGGMVMGRSHAQGGEKFAVGGRVVELEGGEAVINKRSTSMFKGQLSAMNAAGGGVKFADGGLMNSSSFTSARFNSSGFNQSAGSGKVVVVESDITNSQTKVKAIQNNASF